MGTRVCNAAWCFLPPPRLGFLGALQDTLKSYTLKNACVLRRPMVSAHALLGLLGNCSQDPQQEPARIRRVPPRLMDSARAVLGFLGSC